MLHTWAVFLTNILLKNQAITEEDQGIYVYGWQMIISTGASLLSILVVALILNQWIGALIFLLFSLTLRSYAGGFHANSYGACFLLTLSTYLVALVIHYLVPLSSVPGITLGLLGISILLIFWRAPQDHPNRPLVGEERKKFTQRSRVLVLVQAGVLLGLLYGQPTLYSGVFWAALGTASAGVSLLKSNWPQTIENAEN